MHSENIFEKFTTFEVFHLDISGKEIKDIHPSNIPPISITFSVFHFDISDISDNILQPENAQLISEILDVSHLKIFGKEIKVSQPLNILHILLILFKSFKYICIFFSFLVNLSISISSKIFNTLPFIIILISLLRSTNSLSNNFNVFFS